MNYHEIKVFVQNDTSRAFHKMNPDARADFSLYDIVLCTIDLEMITAFRPSTPETTQLDIKGDDTGYQIPMSYENFKAFFYKKMAPSGFRFKGILIEDLNSEELEEYRAWQKSFGESILKINTSNA
jgi:hypothetical protein